MRALEVLEQLSVGCWQLTPRAGPPPQPFRPHETPRFHPQGLWTGQHPAAYSQPLVVLVCKVEEPSHVKEGLSGVLQQE